ncbi:ribosome biogenesis GTPase Der [Ureaplasma miroungigenitalium]|uniref:ribosome biogenesis GTPase Der n=1 Tax=Ureaplasma miroungigenitalium TaxID=1042321 RepID=UPI0021E86607|nr:ribosome biogenesis GTPase Der [Ureaplasma miroungigenitalium]MCV3734052.1 ribosome biogenesis GTPase Der [Ureaplasma miroungigenitalium]
MQTIAIVGKPNVGKSSLFNKIIRRKQSIVNDQAGITRDRIYGLGNWLLREFMLIDTGGLLAKTDDVYQPDIIRQVNFAIDEANVIIFLVSHKDGIDANDMMIAKMLKKTAANKKILLVVNKSENNINKENENQLYALGFGKPIYVSAEHSVGVGDLLDALVIDLPPNPIDKDDDNFEFCVIGVPNVGKSSLLNAILNEDRSIVHDQAGSTRDSIDAMFKYNKKGYTIIDTAGVRRKGKISEDVEKYAVLRTQKAIQRASLILFMIDGSQPISEQDEVVGGLAYQANIPTIIVVNKWDAVQKDDKTMQQFIKKLRSHFKYLSWAPIVFISAKENKRIHTIFETIEMIREQKDRHISTSVLTDTLIRANVAVDPALHKGGRIQISYAVQVESQIPTFVIKCNNPKYLHFSYARYIENEIRARFGFDSVPITLYWQDKNKKIRGLENE